MHEALSEGRRQRSSAKTASIRVALLRALSRASLVIVSLASVSGLVVVYRLWALATSRLPHGFPQGWLFDISGVIVAPLRSYDHTEGMTKSTGYLDFPALIALEACLVAILVFAVFGYLFYLLQPHPAKPTTAPAPRRPSRVRPMLGHAVGPMVSLAQRPDWARYRAEAGAQWAAFIAWLTVTMKRGYESYMAGATRDAIWLRERWVRTNEALMPVFDASDCQMYAGLRRARRSLRRARVVSIRASRASSASLRRTTSRTAAAVSGLGAGAGSALERGSGWYWSNFDAASNRVAALVSRHTARDDAAEVENVEPASSEADNEQLSRREFFRRFKPLPKDTES
jgi:hypothetical protein